MQTVDFAGITVDNVSLDEATAKVATFFSASEPKMIVTPNPEIIVASQQDEELKQIINSADLRVPDGISMVVVSKLLGRPIKERVSGIDLMLSLMDVCGKTGSKVFLLGGAPGVAQEAASKLVSRYQGLNIVGTYHGYFKNDGEAIDQIKVTKPDVLFVGLGAGQQERWLNRHLKEMNIHVSMVIGGSLDVISGRKKRAPQWIQALYIEWLYRLITEPGRWKRQLALPKFLYLTLFRHAQSNRASK
ncbi:MAG: WecB/TagA/CpsF family glycosyltransferase [Candidatus Margulisbacteria bacterium]|nr:WecB/TagA/CpsF family glycosyltransferase [Candidatus Margulisiibacteriota bacterium]